MRSSACCLMGVSLMKVYLHPNRFCSLHILDLYLFISTKKWFLSLKGYTLSNTGCFMYICNRVVQEVLFWHEELVMLSILEWLCEIMWDDTEKLVGIIEIILLCKDKSFLTYHYREPIQPWLLYYPVIEFIFNNFIRRCVLSKMLRMYMTLNDLLSEQ